MRGIDLYSGIGGWSLGFRAAGAEILRSYEIWSGANATHALNYGKAPGDIDIRRLDDSDLPEPGSLDFVVGSPPCTQFSFSNRGGSGDLSDGLVDIRKFLTIVRALRPRAWAMENVPRVAGILRREIAHGGSLSEFADLVRNIEVVDTAEFGLPQARKRMLAGNFDSNLLLSYRAHCEPKTLGQVLHCLSQSEPFDLNWGFSISADELTDHWLEPVLSGQEERMNREAKTHHPVYNRMGFPDREDRPARTVTATCTRVSRESIVVRSSCGFRRLTIRERALLQGFPISFQFAGASYGARIKQVGNAIPPVLTYYVAQAMMGTAPDALVPLERLGYRHCAAARSLSARPEESSRAFPKKRSFRFAIPGLRFHSGVRFELRNRFLWDRVSWSVEFYYGTSKRIVQAELGASLFARLGACLFRDTTLPASAGSCSTLFERNDAAKQSKARQKTGATAASASSAGGCRTAIERHEAAKQSMAGRENGASAAPPPPSGGCRITFERNEAAKQSKVGRKSGPAAAPRPSAAREVVELSEPGERGLRPVTEEVRTNNLRWQETARIQCDSFSAGEPAKISVPSPEWLQLRACQALREAIGDLEASPDELQRRWSGRAQGEGPFELVDRLGSAAEVLSREFTGHEQLGPQIVTELFPGINQKKAERYWPQILAGAALGSTFNARFSDPLPGR
jgi:DNA (cytosine-5)-methyltransferase 1